MKKEGEEEKDGSVASLAEKGKQPEFVRCENLGKEIARGQCLLIKSRKPPTCEGCKENTDGTQQQKNFSIVKVGKLAIRKGDIGTCSKCREQKPIANVKHQRCKQCNTRVYQSNWRQGKSKKEEKNPPTKQPAVFLNPVSLSALIEKLAENNGPLKGSELGQLIERALEELEKWRSVKETVLAS